MNTKRLTNPEIGRDLEGTVLNREARRFGGYLLSLTGYGMGIAAIAAAPATAGLSIPLFGAFSAASYAGGRMLMRPAYQNDQDYAPVAEESGSQKFGRYAIFGLGILSFNVGANLITGGLFNAFPNSIGVIGRTATVVGGYFVAKYGARAVHGSFDPLLHSEEPVDPARQMNTYQRVRSDRAVATT